MPQREYAYNKIRNAITYGELQPGERLIEKKLCEIFKVGRTPLREALSQLQIEGYLDFIPNKGVTINRISISHVEEIYNILTILESYATELATKNIDKENERELRSIHNDLKRAWAKKDYKTWLDKNAEFHEYFIKATGNSSLNTLVKSLRNRIYRYRLIAMTIPDSVNEYFRSHEEILEAISKNDAKRAGKAMERHVSFVAKKLVEFLRQVPGF